MRSRRGLSTIAIVGAILLAGTAGASAWQRYGYGGYVERSVPLGYGFADEVIAGSYIGAPFARVPSPSELVPPAWGYGTYGIPTTTGIRQAPAGRPTVTVINADGPPPRSGGPGARVLSRGAGGGWVDHSAYGGDPSMPRIISVTVPRR